jgi:hypothetical protein
VVRADDRGLPDHRVPDEDDLARLRREHGLAKSR